MRNPILTSALWGCGGMLAGAALATAGMLPFYPHDSRGFEDLGWWLLTMALGAVLALLGGGVGLLRGLRGLQHRWATVWVFVPLAVLLAGFSAGVAALAAPPLARWLVELVAQRRSADPAPQWGPAARP